MIGYRSLIPAGLRDNAVQTFERVTAKASWAVRTLANLPSVRRQLTARAAVMLAVLCVLVGVASAQSSWTDLLPSVTLPADQMNLAAVPTGDLLRNMANGVINTVESAFSSAKDRLKGAGESITYMLFAVVFVWALVKSMVQGDGINAVIAEFVPLAATLFLIELLILQGGAAGIVGYLDAIASQFGGSGGGLKGDLTAGVQAGMVAISNILSMPWTNTSFTFSIDLVGQIIFTFAQILFAAMGKLLAAGIIVVATGIYIANVVLAHGSIALALALAPIMVPWLIVPAMSWLFDSWLKFTIGAGMIKIVGAFMLSITSALMNGMANLSNQVRIPPNTDPISLTGVHVVMYMGLALVAFLAAYLTMLIPGIAAGLVSGTARGAGFTGMRALTAGTGFGAVNATMQRATSAAGSAVQGAARGVGGVAAGASRAVDNFAQGAAAARRSDDAKRGAPSAHPGHMMTKGAAYDGTMRNQTPVQAGGRMYAAGYKLGGGAVHRETSPDAVRHSAPGKQVIGTAVPSSTTAGAKTGQWGD